MFVPYNDKQKYATPTCKTRAYRNRKKPTWIDMLQYEDRCILEDMKESKNPQWTRAHELIVNTGLTTGWRAAALLLRDIMYAIGALYNEWDGCPALPLADRYGQQFRPGVFVSQIEVDEMTVETVQS
jgi:hypothetical protein